jgi:hypothetical protein
VAEQGTWGFDGDWNNVDAPVVWTSLRGRLGWKILGVSDV